MQDSTVLLALRLEIHLQPRLLVVRAQLVTIARTALLSRCLVKKERSIAGQVKVYATNVVKDIIAQKTPPLAQTNVQRAITVQKVHLNPTVILVLREHTTTELGNRDLKTVHHVILVCTVHRREVQNLSENATKVGIVDEELGPRRQLIWGITLINVIVLMFQPEDIAMLASSVHVARLNRNHVLEVALVFILPNSPIVF